jgi:hypothetical protein
MTFLAIHRFLGHEIDNAYTADATPYPKLAGTRMRYLAIVVKVLADRLA